MFRSYFDVRMFLVSPILRIATVLVCGASLVVTAVPLRATAPPPAEVDVRGMWVLRTSLTSPASIAAMVSAAKAAGMNTLLVQVRGRGEAFYKSDIEPRATELARQPESFDPLQTTLDLAHQAGLRVHAWVNVNLVSSAAVLPRSRDHVAHRHPEWLMTPRALADELRKIGPQSPAYVGTLSRWVRANVESTEGLYLSPITPAAQAYSVSVIRELLDRYAVDGLHLDYIRYPNAEFDFSAAAIAQFRAAELHGVPAAERERLDRAAAGDAAAWPRAFPDAYAAFRVDRLTALVARINAEARAARPALTISAAVVPDASEALRGRLQNWSGWAAQGYLDVVCPMIYTTDAAEFSALAAKARRSLGATPMWAGIGAYRLPVTRTAAHVQLARKAGAAGVLLFSYDSLIGATAPSPNYLLALRSTLVDTAAGDGSRR